MRGKVRPASTKAQTSQAEDIRTAAKSSSSYPMTTHPRSQQVWASLYCVFLAMRRPSSLATSLVLAHLSTLSCLAAPVPPVKEIKPYMFKNTHHDVPSDVIHFNKGKPGDNQVLHALVNDPNVGKIHYVLNGIADPRAAHKNLEHYMERHIDSTKPVHVYQTPNHLHEGELHETVFDTLHEDKTPVVPRGPLLDFEKDLGKHLEEGKPTWVHSTAPTSLWHLKHVASETKAKKAPLSHINLSVGHNSQQYHADPAQKLPEEGRYLTGAQGLVRGYHSNADIRFTNSRVTFPETHATSVNRYADETAHLLHPTTLEQAKKDIFHGPTVEKVYKSLKQFKEAGAIHPDFPVPDPHPPVFKKAGIPLRDAVHDMLTTKDKKDEQLHRVLEGRKHFKQFLHAAPIAMKQALDSNVLKGDHVRGTQKRLDRIKTKQFRAKFSGVDPYPVEFGDPTAMSAHRQAHHNKGNPNGPKYEDIHFKNIDNRWTMVKSKPGDPVHGKGLFDADSNEAFHDHSHIITNGKKVGYIEGSGRYPKDEEMSS